MMPAQRFFAFSLGSALLLSAVLFTSLLLNLAPAVEPAGKPAERRGPLTPQQARPEFRVAPGLRVELVAAEPEIESPVAMAFDEDGRLWVVEMRDYPNGPDKGKPAAGRIRVLEDREGKGRYTRSTVFADHLLFANGLLPWRGGVVVTAAPHILYLRDDQGTGKATRREVLYEGFAAQNPQLRVSNPILGLDNWIYVANGLRGGQVRRAGQADAKPINLSGMDFRFDLVHDRAEAISGLGQYGNTFDDWGRRFVCDNRHHLRHIVLPNRHLQRNPFLAVTEVLQDISETEAGSTIVGAGAPVYPISKNWTTSNLHAGHFTAACGVFVYRGNLLPEPYRGAAFTCEPTGNLVHAEVMKPRGATFLSRPVREKVEFLATTDDWCRPVFVTQGPDDALYVVDMYRAVIEHPDFMPPELKNRPDLILGKDKGRIWRIVPENCTDRPPAPSLSHAGLVELVELLEHPNSWYRTTAQRLLLERKGIEWQTPMLRSLAVNSRKPLARVHAAWLLESKGKLDAELVLTLLRDKHPRVREQAVILSERWLAATADAWARDRLLDRIIDMAADVDPQVRFQVALTLGEYDHDRILLPLATIALAGANDPWTRRAVATAVPRRAGGLITTLLRVKGLASEVTADRLTLLQELAALVGARRDATEVAEVLEALLNMLGKEPVRWQMAGLNGLADGMGRRGTQLGVFLKSLPTSKVAVAEKTVALLGQAATLAADPKRDSAERLAAVRLLAHAAWPTASPALTRLITEDAVQEVRLSAVRALAAHPGAEVPELLMKSWKTYTPAMRREVTEAMLRQPDRTLFFLNEVAAGRVKPGDVDALRTRQLVRHSRPEIRDKARKLLQANLPADRAKVLARYKEALALRGDPKRGQAVFQKNCTTCHRIAGLGVDVGPDISDTRTKTPDALLVDILIPNQAIDSNYINYIVTTKSGKVITGIISAETAASITLRRAENQTESVLRQDIDDIQSTGVSLMPDGLEKTIPIPDMADLLSFLKNWRYLNGEVPLEGAERR